jgi:hypothetical protein
MGVYINPPEGTKELWLVDHGDPVAIDHLFKDIPEDKLAVVLMDNGMFTAAGIAYNEREYNEFTAPDGRPKWVFLVSKKDLLEVTPGLKDYLK